MSAQLGVINPVFFTNEYDLYYSRENTPSISYLYNSNGQSYLFDDPEMQKFSLLPTTMKIENKEVVFTINKKHAIYYDRVFIYSLPELFKKVEFPYQLKQDLLDKIATIANYLAQGLEYEYLPGTAKQEKENLFFVVKKGKTHCRVTLLSFRKNKDIYYKDID